MTQHWLSKGGGPLPDEDARYATNAEEADMKLWKHALVCNQQQVLIYSPDTDVYNIGLTYASTCDSTEFIVQINLLHNSTQKYINVNALYMVLRCDFDLASLLHDIIHLIF